MDFNLILNAHKGFAYLILLSSAIFIIALLIAMFGYSGKISKLLRKSTLFTMILFHVQTLVGLVMLFLFSPGFKMALHTGTLMSDATSRHNYVEHPTAMIISTILMTILNKKLKTNEKLSLNITIIGFFAMALMLWAFQWGRVF